MEFTSNVAYEVVDNIAIISLTDPKGLQTFQPGISSTISGRIQEKNRGGQVP